MADEEIGAMPSWPFGNMTGRDLVPIVPFAEIGVASGNKAADLLEINKFISPFMLENPGNVTVYPTLNIQLDAPLALSGGGGTAIVSIDPMAGVNSVTVSLTAVELNHLNSSPITIVPAPGVGNIVAPNHVVSANKFGTVQYGGGPVAEFFYGGPGGTGSGYDFLPLTAAADMIESDFSALSHPTVGLDNQPLVLSASADFIGFGAIAASNVTAGSAGAGYAPGDTGGFNPGGSYTVNTVGAGGAVLTYTVTDPGHGIAVQNAVGTFVNTGAGDGNFEVDITAITPADGTGKVQVFYSIFKRP